MCECGCSGTSQTYRLGGGRGWFYLVEIYPGCRNCTAPPSISIRKINRKSDEWEDLVRNRRDNSLPDLPRSADYLNSIDHIIRVAPDPDDFANAVVDSMKEHVLDDLLTKDEWRDIADAIWDDAVFGAAKPLEVQR